MGISTSANADDFIWKKKNLFNDTVTKNVIYNSIGILKIYNKNLNARLFTTPTNLLEKSENFQFE